jgi:asparagine synthase (glutamine-hydrolysing)
MCGICGIINFNQSPVEETSIRQMMHIMKHRGPDDDGVFMDGNIGLGYVRLSIIDLTSAGHQPMEDNSDRYVMVFNGEIYNYIELKEELKGKYHFKTHTDSEVLLAAYIVWGDACLHKFNGMFALAIYDKQNKSVFIARDRFGVKPFYYIQTKDYFAFCSEIPPLLTLLNQKPKPNYQSIFDFLVFNRTDQTEQTFFEEVKKLQHGHQCKIQNSELKIKKWYDLREQVKNNTGFKDAKEFRELFNSSIGLRLRSDVPIGVCLSGGLDSSSIVSVLLQDYDKKELNTFSAVYNKGQTGDETDYIHEYSAFLKNMYYTSPDALSLEKDLMTFVKAHGEPVPGTSPYAQFKVMELAKGTVVVTLDGQGADELLAGYHYFFGFYFKGLLKHVRLRKLCYELYQYLIKHKSLFGIKSFIYFLLPKHMCTKARVTKNGYLKKDFINRYENNNSIASNLYGSSGLHDALIDHFEYKLEHLLKWEDRNSMWFSLEARIPFLDYRLVEKALATSINLIMNKGMTKNILRESMKGIVPEKIRMRRDKTGFETPQNEWFKSVAWEKIIRELINSESFKNRNLIDPQKALMQYEKHLAGSINIAKEIWKWVHLELWFREFIDLNAVFIES